MMKRYRRSRHRHNRGVLFLLLFLIATFLVSCVAGADPLWIKEIFGVDVGKYDSEEVEQTLEPDGEVAQSLCDTVEILTRNSVHLESFQTTAQAVKLYRDAILNDMLRDNYALYNGNSRNLAEAETAYPQTVLCTLIPQSDFENAVYRNFGGTTVSHGSGQVFLYLSRVNAYTAPLQAWEKFHPPTPQSSSSAKTAVVIFLP
jgi:hypothetical protein